jgi:hypothetical protein
LCPHSFDVNLCCFCRLTSDISDMIETDDLDIFTLPDLEQYNVSIYYVTDSVTWQEASCTFLSQPNFVVWKMYHMIIWKQKQHKFTSKECGHNIILLQLHSFGNLFIYYHKASGSLKSVPIKRKKI